MLRLGSSTLSKTALRSTRCYSAAANIPVAAPSYLSLSSHEFGYEFDAARAAHEFSETLKEMEHRLRPLAVPAASRAYVFRPKNAGLLPQINVTDKAGARILEPEVVRSQPSGKLLMRLLRRAGGAEQVDAVLGKMATYARYYPTELEPKHVCAVLTAGARSGRLYPVMDYVFDKLVVGQPRLLNLEVAREALRLYAIRAATLEKKESSAAELVKLWHKLHRLLLEKKNEPLSLQDDLQANLVMAYGLAPQFSALVGEKKEEARALVAPYLSSVARLVVDEKVVSERKDESLSKTQTKKQAVGRGLRFKYMDYVLGKQGLSAIAEQDGGVVSKFGVDSGKLDALIGGAASVFEAYRLKLALPRYVEQAAAGILQNTQSAREASRVKTEKSE